MLKLTSVPPATTTGLGPKLSIVRAVPPRVRVPVPSALLLLIPRPCEPLAPVRAISAE